MLFVNWKIYPIINWFMSALNGSLIKWGEVDCWCVCNVYVKEYKFNDTVYLPFWNQA